MENTKVAVIVAVYNGAAYLRGCFGSLADIRRDGLDVSFFAVDDWSKDDGMGIVAREFPWVRRLKTPHNVGFGGCNNHAIRQALEEGAEYVYLINQDTEADRDFLVEAVKLMRSAPRTGSVQSLLIQHPETSQVNSAGNAIHFLGFGYCLDYRRPVAELGDVNGREIAYASGAGVLFSAAALREVGLFDEAFFMYHEDLDLGWRLRLAGYRNRLAAASRVYHKYEFSRSITKYHWMERNRYYTLIKDLRAWSLIVLLPWVLLAELGLLPAAIRGGWWREKFRAYAWFLRSANWRRLLAARREVQSKRRVGDREIARLFVSTIGYQEVAGPFTRYVANPLMTALWSVLRLLIV